MTFDELIAEAEAQPFRGWDFSWLGERISTTSPPWSFEEVVLHRARASPDLLDLGTGGGEWLAALPFRPERTVATEAWAPNVPVARERLAPLGVEVVQVEVARDNVLQTSDEPSGRLPFPDDSFRLVVSRHESFVAAEVARILEPCGWFVTQQLDPGTEDFARLLELPAPPSRPFDLTLASRQLEAAGFEIADAGEGAEEITFADVGALAWYLKAIPWTLPGFTIAGGRERLHALHAERQPLHARLPTFYVEAVYR